MLKTSIEKALNNQIELEAYASFFYLSLAYWCDKEAMEGCTEFFKRQSEEERMHMLKLMEYLSEADGSPITPAIKQPPIEFNSIQEVFELVYKQEQIVTKSIHKIVDLCYKEQDHATLSFLQWYVEEQREEEAMCRTILDRIKIIGEGGQSTYYIDKEVEKINAKQVAAEAAEAK